VHVWAPSRQSSKHMKHMQILQLTRRSSVANCATRVSRMQETWRCLHHSFLTAAREMRPYAARCGVAGTPRYDASRMRRHPVNTGWSCAHGTHPWLRAGASPAHAIEFSGDRGAWLASSESPAD